VVTSLNMMPAPNTQPTQIHTQTRTHSHVLSVSSFTTPLLCLTGTPMLAFLKCKQWGAQRQKWCQQNQGRTFLGPVGDGPNGVRDVLHPRIPILCGRHGTRVLLGGGWGRGGESGGLCEGRGVSEGRGEASWVGRSFGRRRVMSPVLGVRMRAKRCGAASMGLSGHKFVSSVSLVRDAFSGSLLPFAGVSELGKGRLRGAPWGGQGVPEIGSIPLV